MSENEARELTSDLTYEEKLQLLDFIIAMKAMREEGDVDE